jgi:hypothetical protein
VGARNVLGAPTRSRKAAKEKERGKKKREKTKKQKNLTRYTL